MQQHGRSGRGWAGGCLLLWIVCQCALAAPVQESPQTGGIEWFRGGVQQAFALAEREHRPVMLFWGAQWCPFCHTLKATVFPRPDFIAKTRLFVPVYLDGDDTGAQRWGERFGIEGYPTLVLLDSQHHEIMRLGAGRDVSEYAAVLDLALQRVQPVGTLLALAGTGQRLSAEGCRRLAFNGWDLDTLQPSQYAVRASQLAAAARACPAGATVERARLVIYAAGYAADAQARTTELAAPAGERPGARRLRLLTHQVTSIVGEPQLARSCAPALQTLDASFFELSRRRESGLVQRLRGGYVATMDAAARDNTYALADQLGFIDAKIVALKALGGEHAPLDRTLLAAADQRIDAALSAEQDPYVRPGLVNASLGILEDSDQYQKAYVIAKAEIGRSDAPYYYQADLAEIAEHLGRKQEALGLLAQAYQGSRGPATRFQWGELYLSGLLRMAPRDEARIEQTGLAVLGELDGGDRIADRARVRLEQLDQQLRAWNRAAGGRHVAVLRSLRARMQSECLRLKADTPERGRCDAFLRAASADRQAA